MPIARTISVSRRLPGFLLCALLLWCSKAKAQNYEWRSLVYNTLSSSLISGASALINKKAEEKTWPTFLRGFSGGAIGGAGMYAGKKINRLIVVQQNIKYAWLSRMVFCAGNSVAENAARNSPFFSRLHYDLGFVRLEFFSGENKFRAALMPASFVGFLVLCSSGSFDAAKSLSGGVPVFKTSEIWYARTLVGSTTGNGFILSDTLGSGVLFHEIFAHEMIHTFQFMEFSTTNYFFARPLASWKSKYTWLAKTNRWIHVDLNYQAMLANYFLVQGGHRRAAYCRNFLENEAEWLSTKRVSCPSHEVK